jgi:hypothetical protein
MDNECEKYYTNSNNNEYFLSCWTGPIFFFDLKKKSK